MSFGLRGSVLDRHSIEGAAPEIDMRERLTRRSRNSQPQTDPQGDEAYHGDGRENADDRIELKPHSGLSEPAPEPGHEKSIKQTGAILRRPNTRLSTAAFVVINQHQKKPRFPMLQSGTGNAVPVSGVGHAVICGTQAVKERSRHRRWLMLKMSRLLRQVFCRHAFRYSQSRPGTLVCERCGHRRHD